MNERIGGGQEATQWAHQDYGNDDMGFMVEDRMMDKYNARYDPDFANSDKLNSPGAKKYDAASAADKVQADANANALDAKFKASSGPCK